MHCGASNKRYITGDISKEKLYRVLGLETFRQRQSYIGNFKVFSKLWKTCLQAFCLILIPHLTKTTKLEIVIAFCNLELVKSFFKKKFFQLAISEWKKLDKNIRKSDNMSTSDTNVLVFGRPVPNRIFNLYDPKGVKLVIRFRFGLSHLGQHKFKHKS